MCVYHSVSLEACGKSCTARSISPAAGLHNTRNTRAHTQNQTQAKTYLHTQKNSRKQSKNTPVFGCNENLLGVLERRPVAELIVFNVHQTVPLCVVCLLCDGLGLFLLLFSRVAIFLLCDSVKTELELQLTTAWKMKKIKINAHLVNFVTLGLGVVALVFARFVLLATVSRHRSLPDENGFRLRSTRQAKFHQICVQRLRTTLMEIVAQ